MSELRAALEGLLTHPGYLAFKAEAKRRWGPTGYARELKRAVSTALDQKTSAEAAIQAVDFACNEVNSLFDWIDQTLVAVKKADEKTDAVPVSRRGPGL